jgi:hypothetical protein
MYTAADGELYVSKTLNIKLWKNVQFNEIKAEYNGLNGAIMRS